MKKIYVLLVFSLLVVSPMAFAFSFSDFFSDIFNFGNSITGAAVEKLCKLDKECGSGKTCANINKKTGIGTCTAVLQKLGEACDDGHPCTELLECANKDKKGLGKCTEIKKSPKAVCGDGKLEGSEKCDDKNSKEGDGCNSKCVIEVGFKCAQIKLLSSCSSTCGDGVKASNEGCDAGLANTNKPSKPAYGGSSSYCTTQCVSESIEGGSCGDGTCQELNENCVTCVNDCLECGVYDTPPTISLTGDVDQPAGSVDISVTVTDGNQCWLSADLIDVQEYSTLRDRPGRYPRISNAGFGCSAAESYIENALNQLENGKYQVFLTSLNNVPPLQSKTLIIDITGSDLVLSLLQNNVYYDPSVNPPLVTVMATKGDYCQWFVDQVASTDIIEGGVIQVFNCDDGLTNKDLSSYSSLGLNLFKVTSDDLSVQREYHYTGSDEAAALGMIMSITGTGAGHSVGGAYEIIFGVAGSESVIDTTGAQQILVAMKYQLSTSSMVSAKDRADLIKLYTNNDKVSSQLRAAASAISGIGELQIAALRTITLDAKKLKKEYKVLVDDFSTKLGESGWTTSVDEHTLELIFKKPGEKTIQVKINRQAKT